MILDRVMFDLPFDRFRKNCRYLNFRFYLVSIDLNYHYSKMYVKSSEKKKKKVYVRIRSTLLSVKATANRTKVIANYEFNKNTTCSRLNYACSIALRVAGEAMFYLP